MVCDWYTCTEQGVRHVQSHQVDNVARHVQSQQLDILARRVQSQQVDIVATHLYSLNRFVCLLVFPCCS